MSAERREEHTLVSIHFGKIISLSGATALCQESSIFPPGISKEAEAVTHDIAALPSHPGIKAGMGYMKTTLHKDVYYDGHQSLHDVVSSIQIFDRLQFPE